MNKQSEFKKKLEDEAYKYQNSCPHSGIDAQYCECNMKDAESYMVGARWAREETLREVLEALRSEFETTDKTAANFYADWLEERFKE